MSDSVLSIDMTFSVKSLCQMLQLGRRSKTTEVSCSSHWAIASKMVERQMGRYIKSVLYKVMNEKSAL